jgi:hypothetical protein
LVQPFFAALGFVIIIISILVFVFDQRESVTFLDKASTPLFSMVAGTIIDAVAALFFVQSNKARQLMTEFFDKLRTDRKLDESLALVSEMGNNGTATRVKALLCLNFAEIDVKDDLFRQVVGEHRLETQKSTTGVEK